ncbi:MAG: GntR family transcriptional regulator [Rhodocyclaceae bacterium]|nr:GntR family transcriptional regulator [Rhodocyclaceae bacterium]
MSDKLNNITLQKTIVEQVYNVILDAICDGRLEPGERLTQDSVAKKLNVSRQPVGQALLLLKQQRFVCESGRRGLMVAPLDREFLKSVYEFRMGIDPLAAGLAAAHATPATVQQGMRLIERGETAVRKGSVPELIAADMGFHIYIYQLAGNPIILDAMKLYWNHLRRAMREVLSQRKYRKTIWQEHRAMLDAIAAHDVNQAQALARRHLRDATAGLQIVLPD